MFWNGYIEDLMKTGKLSGAAILSLEDGVIYAHSSTLIIRPHPAQLINEFGEAIEFEVNEDQVILEMCKNKGQVTTPPGIWIACNHYHLVEWRDDVNVGYLCRHDGGATVAATKTLIIIGTWSAINGDTKQRAGECNELIEDLAEKFRASEL